MSRPKPLTADEIADLLAKAKAATPGPWEARRALTPEDGEYDYAIGAEIDGKQRVIAEIFGRVGMNTRVDASLTANFVAAANPEIILRLIDMIERRDEQIEKLRKVLKMTDGFIKATAGVPPGFETLRRGEFIYDCRVTQEVLAATEPHR